MNIVIQTRTSKDLAAVRALFLAYAASLDVDLSLQNFDREVASLPGAYAAPRGTLLLGRLGPREKPIGCVGVRPIAIPDTAEIKRLFVARGGRGAGLGRALAEAAITFARDAGYRHVVLDTLPAMREAIALYDALGFTPIAPYWNSPLLGTLYFAKALRPDETHAPPDPPPS